MAQLNSFQQGEKRDFSRKKLKELPRGVLAPGNVQHLYLHNNRLKQVCGISALRNTRELNLSCNEFSEFPREIEELPHLEKLYLNQNCISRIPEGVFSRLEKLEFLKLSTNRLAALPSDLGRCESLRYLNLSNNCLRDVTALEGLPNLRELYVKNNNLTHLPAGIFLNTALTMFKATGNPLREPPEEVCAGGVKDIQRYFVMLGSSGRCVRRVKTMFLGSSMAGKSTICHSLRKGSPVQVDAADRTVGIEISKVEMGGIQFLFWDFAGHEEYYFTHHIFITPQALVILTINLASYDVNNPQSFKDSVSFWINNVKLRVPESVVLLVGTHTDECRGAADVQEKKVDIETKVVEMLKERKASLEMRIKHIEEDQEDPAQLRAFQKLNKQKLKVLDLVPMDCTKTEDIEELQRYILYQVQDKELFPSIERTLPHRYQEVESSIQDLKENKDIPEHGIVSIEDILIELNVKLGELDREDVQCILRYLHQIGIIVWYVEISALRETVFVEPSFLIKLFKTTVRHDLVNQLKDISRDQLVEERSLVIDRDRWIDDLKGKATLHNAAIRVLLRKSLQELEMDNEDFVKEIVGTRSRDGKFLDLLRHFEICLPAQLNNPLNPQAPVFFPNRKWEPTRPLKPSVCDPGACLFPNYLRDNATVLKMWGEDSDEDIQVQVYFLPEVPHGFFYRLVIRTCSFYPAHWVGKDHCVVSSNSRLVLFKEKCVREDQLIEIRCKRPDRAQTDAQTWRSSWDMMLVVLQRLTMLTHQWPGLCMYVHSPCRVGTCSAHFPWTHWKDLDGSDIYNIVKDEKVVCRNGHPQRAELLFPKVPRDTKSDDG